MKINSTLKLRGNHKIPRLGYGTWQLTGKDVSIGVNAALNNGYIHIDTAQRYNNEYEIGNILKDRKRSSLFITSKIGMSNFKNFTRKSILESLRRLRLEYLDLVLLHWPYRLDATINAIAYKELINAKSEGLIVNIGVSNFTIDDLNKLHEMTGEWPDVNQIFFTPKMQSRELVTFCRSKGIVVEGYSLLRVFFGSNNSFKFSGKFSEKENEFINSLAKKYNKIPIQIIIRWALQNDIVIFPKSKNPNRIKQNSEVFDFELTTNEVKRINEMNERDNKNQIKNQLITKDIDFDKGLLYDHHF